MIRATAVTPRDRIPVQGMSMIEMRNDAAGKLDLNPKECEWVLKYGAYYLVTMNVAIIPLESEQFPIVLYNHLPKYSDVHTAHWVKESAKEEVQLTLW